MTAARIEFAELVMQGIHPHEAYARTISPRSTKESCRVAASRLLREEAMQEYIRNAKTEIKHVLEAKYEISREHVMALILKEATLHRDEGGTHAGRVAALKLLIDFAGMAAPVKHEVSLSKMSTEDLILYLKEHEPEDLEFLELDPDNA